MLNKFCFLVYAQKSLFIGENGHDFFFYLTLASDMTSHSLRAGSQLIIMGQQCSAINKCLSTALSGDPMTALEIYFLNSPVNQKVQPSF